MIRNHQLDDYSNWDGFEQYADTTFRKANRTSEKMRRNDRDMRSQRRREDELVEEPSR